MNEAYNSRPIIKVNHLVKETDFDSLDNLGKIIDSYEAHEPIYMTSDAYRKYKSFLPPEGEQ